MSELTYEQITEMTETIAHACGWGKTKDTDGYGIIYRALKGKKDLVWSGDYLVDDLTFEPQDDWNDFHLACDAMGVDSIEIEHNEDDSWTVDLYEMGRESIKRGSYSDKQTAAFMALYEFAKWKLEVKK